MKQFFLSKKGLNRDFSLVKTFVFTILFLLIGVVSNAQTTVISGTGAGSFEGANFAADGWASVQGATPTFNNLATGNAATIGFTPTDGTKGVFVTNNGSSRGYSSGAAGWAWIYKDVTLNAGETISTLTMDLFGNPGDAGFDGIVVGISDTSFTASISTGSTGAFSGTLITGMTIATTATSNTFIEDGNYGVATSRTFTFSPAGLGNISSTVTKRIWIGWRNDTSVGNTATPMSFDKVNMTTSQPSTFTATLQGGLWSSPATWVGGVVPASTNDITIPAGSIVTVDQITNYRNLDISGNLQWNTSNTMTITGNLTINSGGRFMPYNISSTGQIINVAGNFTNNGFANLALQSTSLVFNGAGSTLGGSGTFVGDGTNGIIRSLNFNNLGSNSITTTQNLIVTNGLAHTAGSLNTNGKLSLDNTAQVYGQSINTGLASVAVTSMGSLYSVAPVVFGASVTQYVNALSASLGARYVSGSNVYLCTAAAVFNSTPPTSTNLQATFTTSGPTLLFIGTIGTIGTNLPFNGTLSLTTQYFHGDNVYQALVATAIVSAANMPVHTTGVVNNLLYLGSVAKATVNYDATTQTVRSLTVTQSGSGFTLAPTVAFSIGVAGGTGSGAAATAVVFQSIAGPLSHLFQKSGGAATITGGLTINSDQGATALAIANSAPAITIEQSSSGVGAISTSNGGLNYTIAPTVGFTLPTGINLVTAGGSGYAAAPTITVTGGTLVSGVALTSANFAISVHNGTVQSVYLTGGTGIYSVMPTLTFSSGSATLAFPAGCLPTATANIGTNRQLTSFTMTNSGYGYIATPTVGLLGGTFTTVANAPTARIALYNLTTNFFTPATAAVAQGDDAAIPASRKIYTLAVNGTLGLGMNLTGNLTLFANTTPLAIVGSSNATGNILDLGGNSLIFTGNTFTGISSTFGATNAFIRNGSIVLTTRGGSTTLSYPFSGNVIIATGSGSLATGSNVTRISVASTAAPTGTVNSGTLTGNRGYRVVTNSGGSYGTNPIVTINYNSSDSIASDNAGLFVAQATALAGPWTVKSITSGSGSLTVPGSRATATVAPGPIAMTGDDFLAFSTMYAAYVSAATGNWTTGSTWVGGVVPPTPLCDNVFIMNGHTVTSDSAANLAKNLTINSSGTLLVSGGDLTVGCGANNNTFLNNGTLTVTGGTLNINGNLDVVAGATFNQSGGAINVDGNDNGSAVTSVATSTSIVRFLSHLGSVTGGNLTIVDPNANAAASTTFAVSTTSGANSFKWSAAHTTSFGNGFSTDTSLNTAGFVLDGYVGSGRNMLGSVIVDGGSGTNRWLSTSTASGNGSYINGNLTINSGSEVRGGSTAQFVVAGNIINNGTLTTQTTTIIFGTIDLGANVISPLAAQSVSGAGVFRNLVAAPTHKFTSFIMNNANGVTFADNDITLSGGLTVNGTGVINVASGKNLTMAGTVSVTAPATLTFESNSNLIQTAVGTNTGNITVKRNTAMQRLAYTYWGSPVAAQQLLAFSPATLTNRFSTYDEPTGAFVSVAAPGSTNFVAGKGYSVRAPNTFDDAPAAAQTFVGTFTGVPNNGTVNFTGTRTSALLGDNLVGNPYPCTINTDTPTGFFAQNTNVGTLYFWTKSDLAAGTGANYASQTTLGGIAAAAGGATPNGTIQVGQGFFASLPTTASTITFNNGMKIGNNANQFFRTANTIEKHVIKLNLISATTNYNQIAVGYMTGATSGVDNQIDGPTFGGGASMPTMISSLINGVNYAIQGRGLPFTATDEVALGFKTDTAGNYTLSTESFDGIFAINQDFFLRDNLTGVTHNIKQAPYNFVSAVGTFNARFQLVYQNVLGVNNPTLESSLVVFVKNEMINIKSTVAMTAVKIFDLRGRMVYEKSGINTTAIELNDLKTEHQVLLVQITSEGKTVTKKMVY